MLSSCKDAAEVAAVSRAGQAEFGAIAASTKPVVAAMMGTAMGGGLELALACHYRVAVADGKTTLALPEVQLGLLPGAGGTQRLPKLVGVPAALDMMLTGKNIVPAKAKKMGLIDQIIQPIGRPALFFPALPSRPFNLPLTWRPGTEAAERANPRVPPRSRHHACQVSHGADARILWRACVWRQLEEGKLKGRKSPPNSSLMDKVTTWMLGYDWGRNFVFNKAKDSVMKMTKGNYPAPLKIIQCVRTGLEKVSYLRPWSTNWSRES